MGETKPYKVGYVPGSFDLFHVGHLNLIRKSKEMCDYLIVGVVSDELLEKQKGHKPVIPLEDRVEIVKAIKYVDEVVVVDYHNDDKLDAYELYRFDCHFSGDDHAEHFAEIKRKLNELGSDMHFFKYTEKVSSSMLRLGLAANAIKEPQLISDVFKVELDLLNQLIQICKKHKLTYYAFYGTLLGALRHKGKIPGDDDIDIALPRPDYDKFLELASSELKAPYFLQTPSNDNCFYGGYSKLMNTSTTAIVDQNWWTDCKEGIHIDIFPLDYGYQNKIKERRKNRQITFYQRLLYAKAYGYFASFKDMPLLKWKSYKYFGKLFSRERLLAKLDEALRRGDATDGAPYGVYAHYIADEKRKLYKHSDFIETIPMQYESLELPAPIGYRNILKTRYGAGYMRARNAEIGDRLHGFYSVDEAFDNYKKSFQGGWRINPCGKKIVLFGDPFIIKEYMRTKGNSLPPAKIVYDTLAPWNNIAEDSELSEAIQYFEEAKEGLDAITWENYALEDNIYPIICTVNIRETEERLKKMGVRDYYIFVYDRSMIALKEPIEYALMKTSI